MEEKEDEAEQMKWNKVYYIDCMDKERGLPSLPDKSVDLCLADPPYGINYNSNHYKNGNPNPKIENDNIFFVDWIKEIYRILKDDAVLLVFSRFDVYDIWLNEIKKYFEYKNLLIWVKNNWTAGDLKGNFGFQYEVIIYATKGRYELKGKRYSNIFYAKRVPAHIYHHQTPKPKEIIFKLLKTLKPISVIDPFLGSGTTAEVCTKLGIYWIGYEINEVYSQDINKRLKNCKKEPQQIGLLNFTK